jgi:DNA-binding FadR family transcriptional regulator
VILSVTGSKIYIEIVNQLREMISVGNLKSGDKIPSERILSERLSVGRSSVREALRALELLGLIETRRGEGTFIRDFKDHQLVPLLSTFILQDDKAKRDVVETKYIIEMDCLRLLIKRAPKETFSLLKGLMESEQINADDFFYKIIQLSENHLLFRIWVILKDYCESQSIQNNLFEKEDYENLLHALEERDEGKTLSAYWELRKLSTF